MPSFRVVVPRIVAGAGVCLGLASGGALAGAPGLLSGDYEGGLALAVATSDKGRITGHLAIAGSNCRIFLHGLPHGEVYRLAIITPGDDTFVAYGELKVSFDGETPVVQLGIPVPQSCQKAAPDLPQRPFRLQTRQAWNGVRLVQANRTHFHDEAHDSTVRKAYVVKWDAIAFDKETPAFARAQYLGGKTAVVGWLRQEDLFPADANPQMDYVRSQLPPMQGRWPQARLPVDVRAYLNARERCEHFEGEEGTDPARQKFLDKARARECGDAKRRLAVLTEAYGGRKAELKFLRENGLPS